MRNMRVAVIPIVTGALGTIPKKRKTEEIGNQGKIRNHSNHTAIEICQNTEKSPGNLWRFAFAQLPVKDQQQALVRKNLQILIVIIIKATKGKP